MPLCAGFHQLPRLVNAACVLDMAGLLVTCHDNCAAAACVKSLHCSLLRLHACNDSSVLHC